MTEQDFFDHVAALARRRPNHPLLGQLTAFTPMSRIYLKHAMKGMEKGARTQVQREVAEPTPPADTPEWRALQRHIATLFGRRANLSNQFHLRPDDRHHCANISDEIRAVQQKIGVALRKKRHYQCTGEMVDQPEEVEREYTGVALSRRYRTTQQNVNRWRNRIKREGPTAPAADLAKWERKLKDYERQLQILKRQIGQETV